MLIGSRRFSSAVSSAVFPQLFTPLTNSLSSDIDIFPVPNFPSFSFSQLPQLPTIPIVHQSDPIFQFHSNSNSLFQNTTLNNNNYNIFPWLGLTALSLLGFLASDDNDFTFSCTSSIAGAPGPEPAFYTPAKKTYHIEEELIQFSNTKRLKPKYDYILVGAGTASFAALQTIQANRPGATVLMVGAEGRLPYPRPVLSKNLWRNKNPEQTRHLNFTNFKGKTAQLLYAPPSYFRDTKTFNLVLHHEAVELDVSNHVLTLDDGTRIGYGSILLATGGSPKTIRAAVNVPEPISSRVTTFRHADDFVNLFNLVAHPENGEDIYLVVGGGALGSELSAEINNYTPSSKVIQAFPESGIFGLYLPRYLSDFATMQMRKAGVSIRPYTYINKIETVPGEPDKVKVVFDNNSSEIVDRVILCVGISPNTSLALKSGLEVDNGICVNSELEARSDVYVAGDAANYPDRYSGRHRTEHQEHAIRSGKVAGTNMSCEQTNQRQTYDYQPMFWCNLVGGDVNFEAVGTISASSKTISYWSESKEGGSEPFSEGVIYYLNGKDQVIGVVFWNLETEGKIQLARDIISSGRVWFDKQELRQQITTETYPISVHY